MNPPISVCFCRLGRVVHRRLSPEEEGEGGHRQQKQQPRGSLPSSLSLLCVFLAQERQAASKQTTNIVSVPQKEGQPKGARENRREPRLPPPPPTQEEMREEEDTTKGDFLRSPSR